MENEISHKIIGAAIEVHKILGGPGLLEGVYESCLCYELSLRGLKVEKQLAVPVNYKGASVRDPLFIDIVVQGIVIVEVKSVEKLHPIHQVQLLTLPTLDQQKTRSFSQFWARICQRWYYPRGQRALKH